MDVDIHDHVRPAGAEYPDGVYRVVGHRGEKIALLRVADADGNRVNTGELERVSRVDLGGFETADNPDAGFTPVRTLKIWFEGAWLLVREQFR